MVKGEFSAVKPLFYKRFSVSHKELMSPWRNVGFSAFPYLRRYLTCFLRNLYTCQEATVRTQYEMTDWFRREKGVRHGCLLSSCLFNLYTEHIMRNASLDELQVGIKIGGRNINNLTYVNDTTLMVENKEALKSLLMRMKE